ncbi:mRNA splicing protein PRP28 PWA37_000128 [Arxiozyma heterogenica]|uniref:mRNA splicing protein PRP28 n=1 Tax=Arxiozyma heterogenica TaxID=278026 RepID=UPI002F197EFE
MARPAKISEILGSLKGKHKSINGNYPNKIQKPKLLSKNERLNIAKNLLTNKVSDSTDNIDYKAFLNIKNNKPSNLNQLKNDITRDVEEQQSTMVMENSSSSLKSGSKTGDEFKSKSKTKSKFQFTWDLKDDTSLNHMPILPSSFLKKIQKSDDYNNMTRVKYLDSLENLYMGKHWSEKSYEEMTKRDWRVFNEEFHISIQSETFESSLENKIRHPLRKWDELNLVPKEFVDILTNDLKFDTPTPIQRISIPNLAADDKDSGSRDLLGVSATGSGKTLAFVIPILIKLYKDKIRPQSIKIMEGPKALILVPTRELAQQIQMETQKFISFWRSSECQVISIVGGHSIEEITHIVSKGCDILVATPGRLIDCLQSHVLSINNIDFLVLDEADKMIDLGFEDQLKTILNQISIENDRVIKKALFTATLSSSIRSIAASYLENPIYVSVHLGENQTPKIEQIVDYTANDDIKFQRLKENILTRFRPPIIIFINFKATADWLAKKFQAETNFRFTILHGSKSQEQREHSLSLFRSQKVDIMIATNVAARGLDIPNVSLVINFQMSKHFEDYVHRIGRTGRAGNVGTAITFLDGTERQDLIKKLYNYMKENDMTGRNKFSPHIKETFNFEKQDQFSNIIY